MSDRFRGALTSAWQRIEERQWIYGKPGKLNVDTSYTYAVPGRAKFIYVTIRNAGGAQTAVPARNDALVPSDNTVVVKMKLEKGVYVIYGVSGRPEQGGTLPENTGGNYSFLELTDVPAAYTGAAGSLLSVNGTEDGVEFTPFPDADDIDESATRLWFDPAEAVKLAGIESLADVTDQANVGAAIDTSPEQTVLASGNKIAMTDAGVLKWTDWDTVVAAIGSGFVDTSTNQSVGGEKTWEEKAVFEGQVGMGTATITLPFSSKGLHVFGVDTHGAIMVDAPAGSASLFVMAEDGSPVWHFQKGATGNFTITESGIADRMTILPGGNVGVGESNPVYRLFARGAQARAGAVETITAFSSNDDFANAMMLRVILNNNASSASRSVSLQADNWGFANPPLILQEGGGDVGIGVSPIARLHVSKTNFAGTDPIFLVSGYTDLTTDVVALAEIRGGWESVHGSNILLRVHAYNDAVGGLTVKNNGVVVIGGTVSNGQLLQINQAAGPPGIEWSISDVAKAYIGVANTTDNWIVGATAGDLAIRAVSGDILFSTNNGASWATLLNTAGELYVRGGVYGYNSTGGYASMIPGGPSNSGYFQWHNSAGTRLAYMGFNNADITLVLENGADFIISGGVVSAASSVVAGDGLFGTRNSITLAPLTLTQSSSGPLIYINPTAWSTAALGTYFGFISVSLGGTPKKIPLYN